MPLLAEYCAAQMFVERFWESLDAEYRGRGVRVQCQIPFYIVTKFHVVHHDVSFSYYFISIYVCGALSTVFSFTCMVCKGG